MDKLPKILFITINGWNDTTGTATIPSIIEGYPCDLIASIFIRPDIPNSNVCSRYFNISEQDVFKSIIDKKSGVGRVVCGSDNDGILLYENEQHRKMKKCTFPFRSYARDAIWKFGRWKNLNLKNFIDTFAPDIIAFPAEGIISFLELAEYIINYTQKPYVMFFWDDNFTMEHHRFSLYRFLLHQKIKMLASKSAGAFAIVPKMQTECECILNCKTSLISKPVVGTKSACEKNFYDYPIKILYAGSTYIDRDKTLKLVVDAIKELNQNGSIFVLDIYTNSEVNQKYLQDIPGTVSIHPGVKKNEIMDLQNSSDVLLFVESLEGRHKYSARLSFSTKLTEYLSANRAIFAIGPHDIAPIEYLEGENAAIVATNYEEILSQLKRIEKEKDTILLEYAQRAMECGVRNHSREFVFNSFCSVVKDAAKNERR